MPSQEHMTWNAKQKRWLKKYEGTMYSVSPRQLKCPPTKDDSRQAANQWWEAKQKKVDDERAEGRRHPAHIREAYQQAIHRHELYAKWQRQFGAVEEAQYADRMVDWLREALVSDNPPFPLSAVQEDPRQRTLREWPPTMLLPPNWFGWTVSAPLENWTREPHLSPQRTLLEAMLTSILI